MNKSVTLSNQSLDRPKQRWAELAMVAALKLPNSPGSGFDSQVEKRSRVERVGGRERSRRGKRGN
jgi:hypothetical protein